MINKIRRNVWESTERFMCYTMMCYTMDNITEDLTWSMVRKETVYKIEMSTWNVTSILTRNAADEFLDELT